MGGAQPLYDGGRAARSIVTWLDVLKNGPLLKLGAMENGAAAAAAAVGIRALQTAKSWHYILAPSSYKHIQHRITNNIYVYYGDLVT